MDDERYDLGFAFIQVDTEQHGKYMQAVCVLSYFSVCFVLFVLLHFL